MQVTPEPPMLLTVRDVAAQLRCGYRTARLLIKDGDIKSVPFGKRRRVPRESLLAWIEQQTEQPSQVG